MYTRNSGHDLWLFVKGFSSNQLARFAPKLYVDLTRQTGRGTTERSASDIASYFIQCFDDYKKQLELDDEGIRAYLGGKAVLEYGPGDILGVALLMYAHGAEQVRCVDRFPLSKLSDKNLEVYRRLLGSLGERERRRASGAFNVHGDPRSGFKRDAIAYDVTKNGLSGARQAYDLVVSRAVLEHVNDLEETLRDIKQSMKPAGLSLHQVDLKSHGLDRYTDFDFLTWPGPLYRLMYSHKGFPNRWRADKYREFARRSSLSIKRMSPTGRLGEDRIDTIRSKIAREFAATPADELSWLGFWMLLEHPAHASRQPASA